MCPDGTIIRVMTIQGSSDLLPEAFLARLKCLLSASQLAAWEHAFLAPASAAFRVNSLLAQEQSVLAELQDLGLEPERLDWPPEAWAVAPDQRDILRDSAAVRDGRLYMQSPSSLVPVQVLAPRPGEEILDLAAAPGGKTIHLAAHMQNQGRIGAVESVKGRFHRLRRNLERCGVTIADTYLADGRGVGRKVPERFDRVLLDAPCSSEGRFSAHDPDSVAFWSLKKIREMTRKQKKLCRSAVQALKPGGVMVYCTCTLAPEENEGIVDDLLTHYAGRVELEDAGIPSTRATAGMQAWDGRTYEADLGHCVRILPDSTREGFFLAKLRKTASTLT